jgi:hypothetical protein
MYVLTLTIFSWFLMHSTFFLEKQSKNATTSKYKYKVWKRMYVKNRLGRLFNALLFLPTLVRFLRNLKLEDNFLPSEFHNEKALI